MKSILLLIVVVAFSSCATKTKIDDSKTENLIAHSTNVISKEGIGLLQQKFNWTSNDILIVNYRQPVNFCNIETFHSITHSNGWWNDFY